MILAVSLGLFAALPGRATAPGASPLQANDAGAALRSAASRGDLESVRALLDSGAVDVNAANNYGATALIVASHRGNAEVVRLLLERGADPDLADTFYGRPPLEWAELSGSRAVVSLLFGAGAGGFDRLFGDAVAAMDVARVGELLGLHVPEADVLSAALQRAIAAGNRELAEILLDVGAVPPPPEIVVLAADVLRRYEGRYADDVGYVLEVTADVDEQRLLLRPPGLRNALRFFAIRETVFQSEQASGITAAFNLSDGRVVSMTFTQGGAPRRMMKQ